MVLCKSISFSKDELAHMAPAGPWKVPSLLFCTSSACAVCAVCSNTLFQCKCICFFVYFLFLRLFCIPSYSCHPPPPPFCFYTIKSKHPILCHLTSSDIPAVWPGGAGTSWPFSASLELCAAVLPAASGGDPNPPTWPTQCSAAPLLTLQVRNWWCQFKNHVIKSRDTNYKHYDKLQSCNRCSIQILSCIGAMLLVGWKRQMPASSAAHTHKKP